VHHFCTLRANESLRGGDRWTKQPENIVYFDNVGIAKEYIGPSGK